MNWAYLAIAIIFELIGTSSLKAANGFTKITPSLISVFGYCISFFFLSLTLKTIPVGIAYAIWSACGIILVSIIGYFFYKQTLDLPAMVGISFIVIGVLIMNLFSKSISH